MPPLLVLTSMLVACDGAETEKPVDTAGTDGPRRVTILHTNDWQSHMLGFGPNAEYTPGITGDDSTVGGLARIRTFVQSVRETSDHPVVFYDAGDWMAGDLFQLLRTTDAAELTMMGALEYDAVTLGNHEFDWGPEVLGQMITIAEANGSVVPILASNTVPNPTDPGDDALEAHFTDGRIQSTMISELDNGVRIGLFGLLGDSAQTITPAVVPASFSPAAAAAEAAVAELEADSPDIIVALTHNGVTDDPSTSPDEVLAAAVPGIDFIIGGHSHTPLFEARTSNGTVIVQAGALTQYVGQLDLVEGEDGAWTVEKYELHEMDDTLAGDLEVTSDIDGYVAELEAGPLPALGYAYATPIVSIPDDVVTLGCTESGMGNLVTDAYRAEMNRIDPEHPIEFAFESQGVVRDNLDAGATGIQGFSDVFRVLPLGFGTDDAPGYALVDFWVTAAEIADVCEVSASISPTYGCNYFIEMSGLRCTFDMTRTQFNRVIGVDRETDAGWEAMDTSLANTELHHVAVDSYVASLMGILGGLTFDSIIITAKDAEGTPYSGTSDMIFDADPVTPEVEELKLWQALVGYMQTAQDTDGDGVPDLSADYLGPEGRFVGFE